MEFSGEKIYSSLTPLKCNKNTPKLSKYILLLADVLWEMK